MDQKIISVLHVDDDPSLLDLTKEFLERENDSFSIETATKADDALDQIDDRSPDCIVSDYDMPQMNGLEFLITVRERYPDLPFILFTGRGSEEVASDAISAGVTDYLRKGSGTNQYELLANRITNAVNQFRAEQQFDQERQRFQTLFDRLSQATVEVEYQDDEPIIKRVNPAFEETFGYDADEIIGDSLDTHIVSQDQTSEAAEINRRVQDGTSLDSVEVTRETTDDPRRFLLQNAVYDDGSGGFAIYADITERKQREHEIKRQNTRLRTLLEHFPEPTLAYEYRNGSAYPTDINEAFIQTFGYQKETVLETAIDELVVPANRRKEAQRIDTRVKAGELVDEEIRRQTAHGIKHFRLRNISLPNDKNIDGYGVYQDITGYKNREQKLERQNDLFKKAQDIASVGAWEYDTTVDELTWSAQVYEIHELPQESNVSFEQATDFYHPDDRPTVKNAVDEAIESGKQYDLKARIITADGNQRWVRTRGDPQILDGEITRVRGTIQDITDQKEHEAELQRERDRLDEFVGVVSHDLRNPLNVAQGRLELAREKCNNEHLDQIDTAIERMNSIIDNMLWLAREGRNIGSTKSVNLRHAVESAWDLVADSADKTELRYATNCDSPPPIRADPDRLCQLLENLLRNAVEHGGENLTVSVGMLDSGFYIEDDGPGIPDKERENVFNLGYSTNTDGTGFGLSIVKQIAQAHDWDVRVADGSKGGARIEVTEVEFNADFENISS